MKCVLAVTGYKSLRSLTFHRMSRFYDLVGVVAWRNQSQLATKKQIKLLVIVELFPLMKATDLGITSLVEEHVLRLQIPVDDVS